MAWLFEDPKLIVMAGVLVELLLGVALFQTRRGLLALVMIGVLLLVAGLLLVERLVVTDREQVADSLWHAVDAVKAGDLDAVRSAIAPDAAPKLWSDVRRTLERFEVIQLKLSGLEITVDRRASPPVARATFRAIASARDRLGQSPYDHFMRRFTVDLRQQGGRWVIVDYEMLDGP